MASKIVFLAGPRQVGKSTLALRMLGEDADESHPAYLNWDHDQDRHDILSGRLPPHQGLIIFDEIHKFSNWRNLLKGLYDKEKSKRRFLVTGSARLDYYSKGGDSLDGRYFMHRLHPYSVNELPVSSQSRDGVAQLLTYSGYPEPLSKETPTFHRRWQRTRLRRILTDDLRDLENIREVSQIELLVEFLPETVGSPLSVEKLKNRLNVAHQTVERWIGILENLFLCFRVLPFGSPKIRAVKKERKLYFWDWTLIEDPGARFENMVACQLLKYVHFFEDTQGYPMELRYIRDTDGREIDFVVLKNGIPEFCVECKNGSKAVSPNFKYFKERTPIERFYQVHLSEGDFGDPSTSARVCHFVDFCKELSMP